jgi:hypothetical protein
VWCSRRARDPVDLVAVRCGADLGDHDLHLERLVAVREDAVLVLAYELEPGQRSVAEIAQMLGINRVAAHMRLKRARARLRKILGEGYPAGRRGARRPADSPAPVLRQEEAL